jgi:hypothetical protein
MLQMLPNFRVRVMPVVGTIPAMFGLAAATFVLNTLRSEFFFLECFLFGKPIDCLSV